MLADSYCQHCHFQGLRPILPLLKRSHTITTWSSNMLSDHWLRGLVKFCFVSSTNCFQIVRQQCCLILPLLKRSHIIILIQLLLSDHRLRGLPRRQPCHLGRHKLVSQLNSRHGNYQSPSVCLNSELTKTSKHYVFIFSTGSEGDPGPRKRCL